MYPKKSWCLRGVKLKTRKLEPGFKNGFREHNGLVPPIAKVRPPALLKTTVIGRRGLAWGTSVSMDCDGLHWAFSVNWSTVAQGKTLSLSGANVCGWMLRVRKGVPRLSKGFIYARRDSTFVTLCPLTQSKL